ncbi:tRNA (guanosine(37)-N1)-methyltransferase TrmD [Rhodospirillales bacterium]|nr:tRNA (guanosine(37)-N1)-methyltransferase TrmD [Rhodospirillales bacterium]
MGSNTAIWTAKVLTLFPEMFPGPLGCSLAGKALDEGVWALEMLDIRSFADRNHHVVDDTPFGGGAGMIMRADVIDKALDYVSESFSQISLPILYLTPRGAPLTQHRVRDLAAGNGVVIVCGRYEGIDERAIDAWNMEEISLGDYILSGGEPAAISLIDASVRLLPGVMGSDLSQNEESFERGLLEYPQYTRPRIWRERTVPDVLLSGHHDKVRAWRQTESEKITRARRPDLWNLYAANRT